MVPFQKYIFGTTIYQRSSWRRTSLIGSLVLEETVFLPNPSVLGPIAVDKKTQ